MLPKTGDKVKYKKSEGYVLSFYMNNDAETYTLNIESLGGSYTDSFTRLTEEDIEEIKPVK